MFPFAAFLAGALLTLLLPVALLIALTVWYWMFSARAPETADGSTVDGSSADASVVPAPAAGAAAAVPDAGPEASHTAGEGRPAGSA